MKAKPDVAARGLPKTAAKEGHRQYKDDMKVTVSGEGYSKIMSMRGVLRGNKFEWGVRPSNYLRSRYEGYSRVISLGGAGLLAGNLPVRHILCTVLQESVLECSMNILALLCTGTTAGNTVRFLF